MSIEHLQAVPHLTTAQRGPLQMVEGHLLDRQIEIEQWFRSQWLTTPPPFYASVDLRNSGFKLAPVDTNLFPAGFNNLNPAFQPLCIHAIQMAVEHFCPKACGILLVPESHTRNIHYLENLATFVQLLELAGFQVNLGSLLPEGTAPPTQVAALRPVSESRRGVRRHRRYRSMVHRPGIPHVRKNQLPETRRRRLPDKLCGRSAERDRRQVPRIRGQRRPAWDRQGRCRHLRHEHHDRAQPGRGARPEPQTTYQDGARQGRPQCDRGTGT